MRKVATGIVGFTLALAMALPAQAAGVGISVTLANGFQPMVASGAQGTTFTWKNKDTAYTHTSTQNTALALWDTGYISPGHAKSVTIDSAGTYSYFCKIHQFLLGTVKVPIIVTPPMGTTATVFTIKLSTTAAVSPFVYDVQEKVGAGTWTTFKHTTSASASFHAATAGTYSFRSRTRRTGVTSGASGWSPAASVTVS